MRPYQSLCLPTPDCPPARELVSPQSLGDQTRYALDFAWLDDNTLLFNTYHYNPKLLVQQQFADDLWSIVVNSGKPTRLLEDGQGGAFTISPDQTHIALVRPGDFASHAPGVITVGEGWSFGWPMDTPYHRNAYFAAIRIGEPDLSRCG